MPIKLIRKKKKKKKYCGKSLFVSRTLFILLVIFINRSPSYKKKLNRNLLSNSKAARVLSMAGDRYPSVASCAWFRVLDLSLEWELFYSHANNLQWNLMANWQLCLKLLALKISGYQASVFSKQYTPSFWLKSQPENPW